MAIDYDIAIIGMGCAGSHIALELIRRNVHKRIVILDDYSSNSLEKTWSYWEEGAGKWDHLLTHSWSNGQFKANEQTIDLELGQYVYKSIESERFIAFAKAELEKATNVKFISSKVKDVEQIDPQAGRSAYRLDYGSKSLTAEIVLDSRLELDKKLYSKATTLLQHFKGWVIQVPEPLFDPTTFVMMDYNLQHEGTTSFTYVLPYSTTSALVEFTYFSKQLVANDVYDTYLHRYLREQLKLQDYSISRVEQGVIPMTTYKFNKHSHGGLLKIGAAGGWVKPSTGYSFKLSEGKAETLVNNIIHHRSLKTGLFSQRHHLYDSTLLEVLYKYNAVGDRLFHKLYQRNQASSLLKFLDERSSLAEELKIMKSMTSRQFVAGFFKTIL